MVLEVQKAQVDGCELYLAIALTEKVPSGWPKLYVKVWPSGASCSDGKNKQVWPFKSESGYKIMQFDVQYFKGPQESKWC